MNFGFTNGYLAFKNSLAVAGEKTIRREDRSDDTGK
jgi:hypothetical protein